jgi:uncharacterized protein YlxW (UPF0749 family)
VTAAAIAALVTVVGTITGTLGAAVAWLWGARRTAGRDATDDARALRSELRTDLNAARKELDELTAELKTARAESAALLKDNLTLRETVGMLRVANEGIIQKLTNAEVTAREAWIDRDQWRARALYAEGELAALQGRASAVVAKAGGA